MLKRNDDSGTEVELKGIVTDDSQAGTQITVAGITVSTTITATVGQEAEVKGTYNNGVLTATEAKAE